MDNHVITQPRSKYLASPFVRQVAPIALLVVINLIAGWFTVRDYGASWDDPKRYGYATNSLKAYIGQGGDIVDDKGPSYVMLARLGSEVMLRLSRGWQWMDAWHWMHFLSFQLSVVSIYFISLRSMGRWAAWSAALLFSTQPLLWGHAFINSKDIPFMSFFTCSVVAGLYMADSFQSPVPEDGFRDRLKEILSSRWIWITGALWGFTTSIRILGPAAAGLVAVYFIGKAGRKALAPLIACSAIAGLVTFLTWPGLWTSPLANLLQSLSQSSAYPWQGKVLFNWVGYPPDELPRGYLPTLMTLQFSETLLLAFLAGLVVLAIKWVHKRLDGMFALILLAWFFVPLIGAILLQPRLYDNFRHFFFILPPLFVIAGLGLQALFDGLKRPVFYPVVMLLIVVPNLYWIARLHPFEYTYYNSLVGGVGGAFRRFETDYWATSYRQATEYLDQVAPQNATLIAWGPDNLVSLYARPDLQVVRYRKKLRVDEIPAAYAILLARQESDLKFYPQAPVIFQVSRGGATFVVVKQLTP